jgi:diadenosine tetraphosphate (Ap4A) HIT family hydrolase
MTAPDRPSPAELAAPSPAALAISHADPVAHPASAREPCPFCVLHGVELLAETPLAVAFLDRFPVSEGHALIVPRRHVATWFDASDDEQRELARLLGHVRPLVEARLGRCPDGWNGGFNAGAAAGQTVMHLHLHLIPRWRGDVPDPRGGLRGVVSARRLYP